MNDRLRLFFRRRNKLINPRYQVKVAIAAAVSLFVYSIIFGALIFYPLSTQISSGDANGAIAAEILALHKRLWPAVFLVALLVFIQVVLASHRVAGPVYRLEKVLTELARGNYKERMRLRKSDQFREVEPIVNGLAESLEKAERRGLLARAEAVEMLREIRGLAASSGAKEAGDIKKKADDALRILGIDE